ncbi:MAG: flavodoxin family protein [Candidatus Aureabacteria bacterium]|nr:flavodoxin family protein [Candidatus Auribacterota bacterium]
MKVIGINGSARAGGNTALLIRHVFEPLEKAGIETELFELAGKPLRGCAACFGCFKAKNGRCVFDGDAANEAIVKMLGADGIILGSPTYFADLSAQMKALIERAGFVARANDDMLRRKPGAAVVAVRRAGAIHAFDSINHFFLISQMIVVGSSYWNIGRGREQGEVEQDEEGIRTMRVLGENMGWVLKKVRSQKAEGRSKK